MTLFILECKIKLKMLFYNPHVSGLRAGNAQMIVLLNPMNVLIAANDMLSFMLRRLWLIVNLDGVKRLSHVNCHKHFLTVN